MSLPELINNRIVPVISMSIFDQPWSEVLNGSLLVSAWLKVKSLVQKHLSPLSFLGKYCEFASLLLVALLFLILPAPQFADDKSRLALLVLASFVIRLLGLLLNPKDSYTPTAMDLVVLSFAAMNVIATAASHYLVPSIGGLAKMAVYFCSYFLFVSVLQRSPRRRSLFILIALLGAGTLVSLYGLYQYKIGVAPLATWEDPTIEDKTTRVYSTLKNPNLLAGYLVPLIPLSLGLTAMALCERGWKKALSVFPLGMAAVIATCSVFTGSRGGWLGIAAGVAALGFTMLVSLWSARPKLRPIFVLSILLLPVGLVLLIHHYPVYEHRILTIFQGSEHSSNAYRLNVYRASFQMLKDSWWIGIGPGNATFKLAYGLYMRSGFDALGTYCVPLEVAVETGLAGLAIFGWLVVSTMARAHKLFWDSLSASERWIPAGAAAGLVAMMVQGLVDTVYYRPQVQFVFWLLIALCVCVRTMPARSSSTSVTAKEADQNTTAS